MADFKYININTTAEKIEKMANLETTTYVPEKGKIPMYTLTGTIRSGIPQHQNDCANKKYVDDAVANAGGGGSVDLSNYYTKAEINKIVGDIETLLGGI